MTTAKRPVTRKGKPAERRRHPPNIQTTRHHPIRAGFFGGTVFRPENFGLSQKRAKKRSLKGTLANKKNPINAAGFYKTATGKVGVLIEDRRARAHKYPKKKVKTQKR